ncbi:MAG: NAD(P)-binding domain-containing protein, partial [Candidatus Omnitrophica bacterium]|nr:NAD(P)-binding domain-containing protein [Candidatus Omnitrophota bacterium]
MKEKGIGIIGCGNMGSILVDAVISRGLYHPSDVYVSDIRKQQVNKLKKAFKVSSAEFRYETLADRMRELAYLNRNLHIV